MGLFDFFKRKQVVVEQPTEERQVRLNSLPFNTTSSYTNKQALRLAAVYSAVEQISNAVASLPIDIVEFNEAEKRPVKRPELWSVLNLSPDRKYTHFSAFKMAVESLLLTGNAYFYIERDTNLEPKALHYINSEFVQPILTEAGTVLYSVAGMSKAIPQENMIHLWLHIDETFRGISVISFAVKVLEGATNQDDTANRFYKGGAGLNGVLKVNGPLTNEQKLEIRDSWKTAFSNQGNGVAILPKGIDYQSVAVSPEDAELLSSRKFSVEEIARFFNISPIKLYVLDDVSYSTLEATELFFLQDTILPLCRNIEEEFARKLFKPSEFGKFGIQFNFTRAMTTNRKDQAEYYRTLLTNGIMSINEVRGEMGLSKIEGAEGDARFLQLSYGSVKDIAEGKYIKQNAKSPSEEEIDNKQKQNEQ